MTADDDHCEPSVQQTGYVLGELHGYAALRDEETGIEVEEDGRAPTQPWPGILSIGDRILLAPIGRK